jgi:hypothetical protein
VIQRKVSVNVTLSEGITKAKHKDREYTCTSFEDVAVFKYLGTTLTDQNCMHEEIKSKLNSGNAC